MNKEKVSVDKFIAKEIEFFKPILKRRYVTTEQNLKLFRSENIQQRKERISLDVFDSLEGQVRYGPFKGLKLNRDTWWGKLNLGSQCLGLYEKHILDFIDIYRCWSSRRLLCCWNVKVQEGGQMYMF